MLSGYLLLFPLSWAYALRALRPRAGPAALLAFPFLHNLFFHMGFYNFCYSLPLFFLTPVLYPLNDPQIARRDWVVDIIHWGNPLSPLIEALRDPLFYGRLPGLGDTIYTIVAAVVALALGAYVFNRVDDQIAVEV